MDEYQRTWEAFFLLVQQTIYIQRSDMWNPNHIKLKGTHGPDITSKCKENGTA